METERGIRKVVIVNKLTYLPSKGMQRTQSGCAADAERSSAQTSDASEYHMELAQHARDRR